MYAKDCPVWELSLFDKKFYSHKIKHAEVRYEDGIFIKTGCIVQANGPYKCGEFPD